MKIRNILLIDDNLADNFYHRIVISEAGVASNVEEAKSVDSAINYLRKSIEGKALCPELIFLDINMPRMNGWEFLEKYSHLKNALPLKPLIFILSTSINPDDRDRAEHHPLVAGFYSKPITHEILNEIMRGHFSS